ncbi:MAG: nucleotide exchange factor GrpE, partial [Firmicutes bacterium HGW-Firmicutes-13]
EKELHGEKILGTEEDNMNKDNVEEALEENIKKIRQNDLEKRGFSEPFEENITIEGDAAAAGEFENLKREKEELFSRLQRLRADFDNYRKRVQSEQAQMAVFISAEIIKNFLPVIDNLERALSSPDKGEGFVSGVEMIFKQFLNTLEKEGLEPIDAEGKPFDPYIHEAVMQVESPDYHENTVVEELQKGYKFKDRLLRPSMVKVAK